MELEAKIETILEIESFFWNDRPLLQIKQSFFDMMIDIREE
jgi:hypothetical protein